MCAFFVLGCFTSARYEIRERGKEKLEKEREEVWNLLEVIVNDRVVLGLRLIRNLPASVATCTLRP